MSGDRTKCKDHLRPIPAGALVNSLAAANQEVPKPLVDLASRDSRFRKGLGSHGSAARGRGRGGAGRGRSQVPLCTTPLSSHDRLPLIVRRSSSQSFDGIVHFGNRMQRCTQRSCTGYLLSMDVHDAGWRGRSGFWGSWCRQCGSCNANLGSWHSQGPCRAENCSSAGGGFRQGWPGIHSRGHLAALCTCSHASSCSCS